MSAGTSGGLGGLFPDLHFSQPRGRGDGDASRVGATHKQDYRCPYHTHTAAQKYEYVPGINTPVLCSHTENQF